eukprot:CAMPEP_0169147016 /NCGR_PEP_ID=MMETSP1015-20121227/47955_1 /TAXON_ID=342587 /ORGANISM="Karlodinium micrum, Strain CCMP2283" /LENGTH=164 /DNA_ID=CAMNT_0009215115 /DNA_START=37 /DNA_END=531 /DNA_ORIENTATION=-
MGAALYLMERDSYGMRSPVFEHSSTTSTGAALAPEGAQVADVACGGPGGVAYDFTLGWLPFFGSVKDTACCTQTGSLTDCICGVGGLGLDVVTLGTGRMAINAAKAASSAAKAVRAGQKGAQLVKASKFAKTMVTAEKVLERGTKAFGKMCGWSGLCEHVYNAR